MKVFFKRKRLKPKQLTTNIDWNLFLENKIKETFNADLKEPFKKYVFMEELKDINFESFRKLLMSSAKKVGSSNEYPASSWYIFFIDLLKPYFDKRTKILNYTRQARLFTEKSNKLCIESRKILQDALINNKSICTSVLANRIYQMSCSPRDSWKVDTRVSQNSVNCEVQERKW